MTAKKIKRILISSIMMLALQACGGKEQAYNASIPDDQQEQEIQEFDLTDELTFMFKRGQDLAATIPLNKALSSDYSAKYKITNISTKDRGTLAAYGNNHLTVGKEFDVKANAGALKLEMFIQVNKMLPVPSKSTVTFELSSDSLGMPKTLKFIIEPLDSDIVKVGTVISHIIGIEGDAREAAHYIPVRTYGGEVLNIPTNGDAAKPQKAGVENFTTTARLWRTNKRPDGTRVAQYFDFNGRWKNAFPLKGNRKTIQMVGTSQVMAATFAKGNKLYYGRKAGSDVNVPKIGVKNYLSPVGPIHKLAMSMKAHRILYMIDKENKDLHRVFASRKDGKFEFKVTKTNKFKSRIVGLQGGSNHVAVVTANKKIHVFSTRKADGKKKALVISFKELLPNATDRIMNVSGRYNRINIRMKSGNVHTWVIHYSDKHQEWRSYKVDNVTYTDDILIQQTKAEALIIDPIERVAYKVLNP